jgi:hypothetical protein
LWRIEQNEVFFFGGRVFMADFQVVVRKPKNRKPRVPKPPEQRAPLAVSPADWESFSALDKKVYEVLKEAHPRALTVETILVRVNKKTADVRITHEREEIWPVLDDGPLSRFVRVPSAHLYGLI